MLTFFTYICIQMIFQGFYRLVIVIVSLPRFEVLYWDDRLLDVMLILMQCANLLMNFGITQSVKKAYGAELKKRMGKKYLSNLSQASNSQDRSLVQKSQASFVDTQQDTLMIDDCSGKFTTFVPFRTSNNNNMDSSGTTTANLNFMKLDSIFSRGSTIIFSEGDFARRA